MNNETIDFHLENLLNGELERFGVSERVEIVNAGVTQYQTFHHLIYLDDTLYHYKPDMVVFVDGHNDFYQRQPNGSWSDYPYLYVQLADDFNRRRLPFTAYSLRHESFRRLVIQ